MNHQKIMSRRRKLEKFAELLNYSHVFEMTEIGSELVRQSRESVFSPKGKWHQLFEKNQPLCVELACGRGEYTLGLARLFPERNFLGIDIKGARIHQGATIAQNEPLKNVAFLRIRIELIALYFESGEIDEIWITFPDPFPAKPNRRLTAQNFLNIYHDLLAPGAFVHLKTDDMDLFQFSLETANKHKGYRIINKSENVSYMRLTKPELNISTYYENVHLLNNKTIKYLHLCKID